MNQEKDVNINVLELQGMKEIICVVLKSIFAIKIVNIKIAHMDVMKNVIKLQVMKMKIIFVKTG